MNGFCTDKAIHKMKFSEDYTTGSHVIRAYTENSVDINNRSLHSSLIVGAQLLIENWEITDIEQMREAHWQQLLEHKPEIILLGTGKSIKFLPPSAYQLAIEQGVGVEFMDSPAACRTYNILISEGRSVVAGIILK